MFVKFLAILFIIVLGFLNGLMMMIYGWGLEIKSLPILLLGIVFGGILHAFIEAIRQSNV